MGAFHRGTSDVQASGDKRWIIFIAVMQQGEDVELLETVRGP